MVCKNCGREIADTSKFCGYCGNKVEPDVSFDIGAIPSMEDFDLNKISLEGINPSIEEQPKVNIIEPVPVQSTQYVSATPEKPDYSWISETAPKATMPEQILNTVQQQEVQLKQPLYDAFNMQPIEEQPQIQPTVVQELPKMGPQVTENEVIQVEPEIELKPFADIDTTEKTQNIQPLKEVPPVQLQPMMEQKIEPQQPIVENKKGEKTEEKKDNKKDFTIFIIVFLTIVIVMLSAFIVWDKYLNVGTSNNISSEIVSKNENTTNMTVQDAKDIITDKYNNLYGDNFKTIYDKILKGDTETASSLFTLDAINKLKVDTNYKIGIFGTENQTKRELEIVSYGDEYIIAKGKNSTDSVYYYIVLKKVDGIWYIDMFE